jgi:hypothetical protein
MAMRIEMALFVAFASFAVQQTSLTMKLRQLQQLREGIESGLVQKCRCET